MSTSAIYTLSLHDALPISSSSRPTRPPWSCRPSAAACCASSGPRDRSEEHTSELQSRGHLVCRLQLEKKNIGARIVDPERSSLYTLTSGHIILHIRSVNHN